MSYELAGCRRPVRRRMRWAGPSTLSGLEFSLRRPRWLRKLKVGRILGKAVKYGAIIGGAALLAPGAAGLVVRGGRGLFRGAALLRRAGGAAFRFTSGRRALRLPFGSLRRAAAFKFPLPAHRAPVFAASPTAPPAEFSSMPSTASSGGGGNGGGAGSSTATEDQEAVSPAGAGGINPALVIGGLVIGGLLLSGLGRRKGRAA